MPRRGKSPALADTGHGRRFLTFRIDARVYAVAADDVSEVIRAPPMARVPQEPKGLLGLANLRGSVLPIASLRGLLGQADSIPSDRDRVIVLAGASPVGLSVDAVDALVSVAEDEIETRQAELAQAPGEALPTGRVPERSCRTSRRFSIWRPSSPRRSRRAPARPPAPSRKRPPRSSMSMTPAGSTRSWSPSRSLARSSRLAWKAFARSCRLRLLRRTCRTARRWCWA